MNLLRIREPQPYYFTNFACYNIIPGNMSWREAYGHIRAWFKKNTWRVLTETSEVILQDGSQVHWGGGSLKDALIIIKEMPPTSKVSFDDAANIFEEIRTGRLEWGYRQSDGDFAMRAYVDVAA